MKKIEIFLSESIEEREQYCSQDFSLLLYLHMGNIEIFLSESIVVWEQYCSQDFTLFLYLQKKIETFLSLSKRENNILFPRF